MPAAEQANGRNDEWRSRPAPVREDIVFQRRFWRVQSAGWAALFLLLLAAALGLFSGGVLSRTTAETPDGALAVRFQRFYRNGATATMTLEFRGGGAARREAVLSHTLLRNLSLETIRPQPERMAAGAGGLHLVFAAAPGEPASVRLTVRPVGTGLTEGTARLAGRDGAARIRFFIYP